MYLLLFHYNNGCTNAPQCYVMRTLPVLFFIHTVLCECGVTRNMRPEMVRLLVNNELVRMWKEAVIYAEIWIPFPSFHICTVHLAIVKVYYQLMHKRIVLKGVLNFTLKLQ